MANMASSKRAHTDLCCLHIGNEQYVVGSAKDGFVQSHIRQYEKYSEHGKTYPTMKGVILSMSDWLILESYVGCVDEALNIRPRVSSDRKWHIANDIFIISQLHLPHSRYKTILEGLCEGWACSNKKWCKYKC